MPKVKTTADAADRKIIRKEKLMNKKRRTGEYDENPWTLRANGWARRKEETFVSPYKTQPNKITSYFRVTREEISLDDLRQDIVEKDAPIPLTENAPSHEPMSPIGPPSPLVRSYAEPIVSV